jgi:hypothetical protein
MPIWTSHHTVLVRDPVLDQLRHVLSVDADPDYLVEVDVTAVEAFLNGCGQSFQIDAGELAGFEVVRASGSGKFNLIKNGTYLCADPRDGRVLWDRSVARDWESFKVSSRAFVENYDGNDFIAQAMRDYQLGNLRAALQSFEWIRVKFPESDIAQHYFHRINSVLQGACLQGAGLQGACRSTPRIVLQCNLKHMWERDWLQYLLGANWSEPVEDCEYTIFTETMIVIDNHLDHRSAQYYREAYRRGCKIMLIHLSDEGFRDNPESYQWCAAVWRNLWSPVYAAHKNVQFFALGYKQGYPVGRPDVPSGQRPDMWCFAGDLKKSSRKAMHDAMMQIPGGKVHLTSGFGSADALDTEAYFAFLNASIFSPCGAGFENLDSFRVYESLEAGCIPIVERREAFDYFTHLLGPHPLPTVSDWTEVADMIANLQTENRIERLRLDCVRWWKAYKLRISSEMALSVAALNFF